MLNTFSVTSLIAWLETQNPETEYDYTDSRECLITRYMLARGVPLPPMLLDGVSNDQIKKWGFYDIANNAPSTCGAALARAKATLVKAA